MNAADVMTTHVITVTPDTTVLDCAKLFLDNHISAAPVLDGQGKLVGIVSEGDLMHRAEIGTDQSTGSWWLNMFTSRETAADAYVKTHSNRVGDVMTASVISVQRDTSLGEIAHLLESKRIKRVPVVENDRVVGVVSRANLLHALASQKEKTAVPAQTSDDRTIRQTLLDLMHKSSWGNANPSNVMVSDGVVEVWGVVDTEQERTALRVAAEEIQGVKKVIDHRVLFTELRRGA
ncbi:MAG: CBS domain-containing protein [Gammaproteobacteria bacterium]|nr:CBS domain-containing protein [Gammaproteobacteria bacterium]